MYELGLNTKEDHVTAVLDRILESALTALCWNLRSQDPGGITAMNNPGERDLVLRDADSCEIALIEAVVCARNPTQQWMSDDLNEHFRRVFAYSRCLTSFHLTYSLKPAAQEVVAEVKKLASVPGHEHMACLGIRDLPKHDDGPMGFVAEYSGPETHVVRRVCFLVLTLVLDEQREHAAAAHTTRARRPKGKAATKKAASSE